MWPDNVRRTCNSSTFLVYPVIGGVETTFKLSKHLGDEPSNITQKQDSSEIPHNFWAWGPKLIDFFLSKWKFLLMVEDTSQPRPPHPLIYHLQMICCSEHNCRQENEGTHRQPRKWPEMEKHWKTPENPAFAWLVVGSVGDTVWQCDTVVGSVGDSQGLPGIAERTNGVISGLITGRRISCHPQKYWNTKNWSHKILAKENARTQ